MADDLSIQELAHALRGILQGWGFLVGMAVTAWTPTYLGQTTAGVTTYTTQDGWYVRIGPVVFFGGRVTWTAATGTGNALVGNLPLAAGTPPAGTGRWVPTLWVQNVTIGAFNPMGLLSQTGTSFALQTPANNAATTSIAVEAAGDIIMTGWYFV